MHWRIFPCHSIVQTAAGPACSCSRTPDIVCAANPISPGKHPRVKGGFKAATDNEAQIRRWWTKFPDANIGLATGSGLVVIDVDGKEGAIEFKTLVEQNEALPDTLVAQTGRGYHLVFATRDNSPEVRSSARGNVHVRGEGGYIIAPPSNHISGNDYKWIRRNSIAILPEWLRQWTQGYEITKSRSINESSFSNLGPLPEHLRKYKQRFVNNTVSEALRTIWSESEEMRLESALFTIPATQYETWVQVGMALKDLGWERPDGTDIGLDIWLDWSETCPEKFSQGACEDKWRSFKRFGVSIGTIYHLARLHGWNGGAPAPVGSPLVSSEANGLNGQPSAAAMLPAAFLAQQPIIFPDRTETGLPRATCTNAAVAIAALGIQCRKDLFHEKTLVAGEPINRWVGELSDEIIQMIRKVIRYRFGFDPNKVNTADACVQLSLEHQFDPVLDYLGSLRWDGAPRLNSWMVQYLGAPDTDLNRMIGRLTLIAAVRRARRPGTKFDQIIVLEGKEGRGKSMAVEILAGRENFSDQKILGLDDRAQQEATAGVWLYEIAELTGMRRAEVEHIKAFASRTIDRARPAYGRFRIDRPRRTVFIATTNDDQYLKSESGNRRFWPVVTGEINLSGLATDRDQLWAEASWQEASGCSIGLPEKLWGAAGAEQEQRLEDDVWTSSILKYVDFPKHEKDDVSILEVLTDNQFLRLEPGNVGRTEQMRAGAVLRRLGWMRYRRRQHGGPLEWRYRREN